MTHTFYVYSNISGRLCQHEATTCEMHEENVKHAKFIHEHQFATELNKTEPSAKLQTKLLEIIEDACRVRSRMKIGYSFVRLFWKRNLLVWYQAGEDEIVLLSIRPDLM